MCGNVMWGSTDVKCHTRVIEFDAERVGRLSGGERVHDRLGETQVTEVQPSSNGFVLCRRRELAVRLCERSPAVSRPLARTSGLAENA